MELIIELEDLEMLRLVMVWLGREEFIFKMGNREVSCK